MNILFFVCSTKKWAESFFEVEHCACYIEEEWKCMGNEVAEYGNLSQ